MDNPTVLIAFANNKQAKEFMDWFDGQGEQDYFESMDCCGVEYPRRFNYDRSKQIIMGQGPT